MCVCVWWWGGGGGGGGGHVKIRVDSRGSLYSNFVRGGGGEGVIRNLDDGSKSQPPQRHLNNERSLSILSTDNREILLAIDYTAFIIIWSCDKCHVNCASIFIDRVKYTQEQF